MKRDIFIKGTVVLIFLALVANLVMYISGTKQVSAEEARRRVTPEYAIALNLKDVAKAIEQVADSNNNIAESIDRLASAVERSKK